MAPAAGSIAAYCSRKGYPKAGGVRSGVTGTYTTNAIAAARVRVANLATGAVCTGLSCSFVRGLECLPAGKAACTVDANSNVGNSNVGAVRVQGGSTVLRSRAHWHGRQQLLRLQPCRRTN